MKEIRVIYLSSIDESEIYGNFNPEEHLPYGYYSPEGCAVFVSWLKKNNYHFYSKPGDSFFIEEAMSEAASLGFDTVVVDSLS